MLNSDQGASAKQAGNSRGDDYFAVAVVFDVAVVVALTLLGPLCAVAVEPAGKHP